MRIYQSGDTLVLQREHNEKVRNESHLWYKLQQVLKAAGFDVVKKPPYKDGHLFDAPYYLRDRKGQFCIYDNDYAIRDPAKRFNRVGNVVFRIYPVRQIAPKPKEVR